MKTHRITSRLLLWAALFCAATLRAQDAEPADSTGLPGDHFSLEGAIELYKKAGSPEEFEKLLNTEDNAVNNLDLNEDGKIDYIRVVDNVEGDAHALVLQVPVSADESQDVAVIEIEKQGEDYAVLQIVGDEDLYGESLIAEPYEEGAEGGGKEKGPAAYIAPLRIVVNVWAWPSVRFIYHPRYVVWVSPWRWLHYPGWWRPWRPHPWHVFHVRVRPFHRHCHIVTTHRVVRAHAVYAPRRTHSHTVHTRTTTVVAGHGRHGTTIGKRTTTTTTGPRGNTTTRTKTTVGHKGRGGNVSGGQKVKTTRRRGRG